MKTESGAQANQSFSSRFAVIVLTCLTFAWGPLSLWADGCFVVPKFVWDKQKDINEPTQKAIIVHDAGREDLILQVKYDGPLEEFGWLIPVPNLPNVKKGSMECFYELSKFTQKNLEPRWATLGVHRGTYGKEDEEPPVKVIEIKTVGAYEIAVLSTRDSAALENWLRENEFAFPTNAASVVDSYVKRNWYFIAAKINLKGGALHSTSKKLAGGELSPLQISFASEQCVFPLKISSLNNTPSEVQVYVLSPEPLVEKELFKKDLSASYEWRTNMYKEPDDQLSRRSGVNIEKLIPYAPVGGKDLPLCSRELGLLKQAGWWLMKETWTFPPAEMRDLEFVPAIPVFADGLADAEGSFAAANLVRLGTNGASALIAAMQNANPTIRAHATSVAEEMFVTPPDSQNVNLEDPRRRAMNPALLNLLPTLLSDPDPEVRLHAVGAAGNSESPIFFNRMLELLHDPYEEISESAQAYLKYQREELPKHIPEYRQMLKDTNQNVQIAGLRLLMSIPDVHIPREELLPLFSIPRMELAGAAVAYLRQDGISGEEAKLLLTNSLYVVRMMGLKIITTDLNNGTVELAIPLLKDPEDVIRQRVHTLLTDLTDQNFPAEQPEQWEKWWEQNKATFTVTITPEELTRKQLERQRLRRSMEKESPQGEQLPPTRAIGN